MNGVYLSPISRWIEIGLAVSGVLIVYFVFRAFMSNHAWGEGAEYDMLDLPNPHDGAASAGRVPRPAQAPVGTIGLEDRIVRFGFSIALGYLGIVWFGLRSLAMWLFAFPVFYFFVTATIGTDPIYKWLKLSTKMD